MGRGYLHWVLGILVLAAAACSDGANGDPGTDRAEDGGYGDGDEGEDPDAGGDDGGDQGEPARFVVLTINLKHPITGIDEAHQRLQIVADVINDRQPDVVALQEVITAL